MNPGGTTIKEIAKLLNISSTTVSRVLNDKAEKYRISEKTAKLVREKARQLNFLPNQIAQNLRLQRTNTIGLVIPDISNPFFANLARTVEIELRKQKKLILLCDTNDDTQLENETLALLMGRKVDGLLIAPVGLSNHHFQHYSHIPTVMIDRYFEDLTIPYVATDNLFGAYEATKYLVQSGHQHIACIQGLEDAISNKERIKGFRKAIDDFEIPQQKTSILGSDFSIENGYEATKAILKNETIPTAIFALNNQIAIGVMQALKEENLSIPEDISLIAFDEQPYFQLTSPPITTIRQPIEKIGQEAVKILFDIMNNKAPESKLLAPEFIKRESVKTL